MRHRRPWLLVAALLAALNLALWLAHAGFALPQSLIAPFVGSKMVRAEVVWKDVTGTHDTRIDRGKVRAVSSASLTLLERDGTVVTIPVSTAADIRLGNRSVPVTRLRKGMNATVVRTDDAPADVIQVPR